MSQAGVPRIAVVGAGYAGLGTALRLARQADGCARLRLIDGRSEHQLITRLHEVAAGRLAPAAAAVPLRAVLHATRVDLHQAWVEGIDLARGELATSGGVVEYDTLVLAPGSQPDYAGVPGAAECSLPLRTLDDALELRRTLRRRIEQAASAGGGERRALLTFLLVGGGYTGVELAAELASWLPELARRVGLAPHEVWIGLLESDARLLPGHDDWLAARAADVLGAQGVQLFLRTPVLGVDANGVSIASDRIEARTVIWTSGVRAPRMLADAGLQVGRAGRARVDDRLAAIGYPNVLVIGDAAEARAADGRELPAAAQVAVQQAERVADNLAAALHGRRPHAFAPRWLGEALSLGPNTAVARVGGVPLRNTPAVLVKRLSQARYLEELGGPSLQVLQCARERWGRWQPSTSRG